MGSFDREESALIAEVVGVTGVRRRFGREFKPVIETLLAICRSRGQMRDVMRKRNVGFVIVSGLVTDFVDHCGEELETRNSKLETNSKTQTRIVLAVSSEFWFILLPRE